MKKTKQSSSPSTNKTTLKQKEQQMKLNGPSTFHDDPLLWHFLLVQNIPALHPLGYFFIHTFIWALLTLKKN
jgi:hypothetical protein